MRAMSMEYTTNSINSLKKMIIKTSNQPQFKKHKKSSVISEIKSKIIFSDPSRSLQPNPNDNHVNCNHLPNLSPKGAVLSGKKWKKNGMI